MRADVNLSVRKPGDPLGIRTEMKNLNSIKMAHRAFLSEAKRHIAVLESGGALIQETRRWDDNKDASFSMRAKEDAKDYRYFPDPDLPPIEIDDDWIERVRSAMPETAEAKRGRYREEFGLSAYDSGQLTSSVEIANLFEETAALSGQPKEAANLVMGELMRLMSAHSVLPEQLTIEAKKLADLIGLITGGKINRNTGKEVFEQIFLHDAEPAVYVEEKGLLLVRDDSLVAGVVDTVLGDNPKSVQDYKSGKEKAFGFLVGQVMKSLKGKADPQIVNAILKEKLSDK